MSTVNTSSLSRLLVAMNEFLIYFRPTLFAFCMIGSFLDILIFSRRRFRTVSCSTYFLSAAVVIVIQYVPACIALFYGYTHVNPVTSVVAICKIYMYVTQSTAMMQRWFIAAASFDRCACSSDRAALRRFATVHVARRVVLAIVIIWFLIPIYRLVFFDIMSNACGIFYSYVTALIYSIYTAVGAVAIPLSIMIPSLILIQRNLAQKRQRRRHIVTQRTEGRNDAQELDRKRDQQVLAILLVQVIVYIILTAPVMVIQIYNAITLSVPNKSIDRVIIEQFVFSIADTLVTMYSAIPFYLNTMTSHIFRNELIIIMRNVVCCRWFTNTARVHPTEIHTIAEAPTAKIRSIQVPMSQLLVSNRKMSRWANNVNLEQTNKHE